MQPAECIRDRIYNVSKAHRRATTHRATELFPQLANLRYHCLIAPRAAPCLRARKSSAFSPNLNFSDEVSLTFPPLEHLRYAFVAPAVWFMAENLCEKAIKVMQLFSDKLKVSHNQAGEHVKLMSVWFTWCAGSPSLSLRVVALQRACLAFRDALNCLMFSQM